MNSSFRIKEFIEEARRRGIPTKYDSMTEEQIKEKQEEYDKNYEDYLKNQ
jgi:hypothetical protein